MENQGHIYTKYKCLDGQRDGMTRPLRINLAGRWYHVTARGNNRQAIYENIANVVCIEAVEKPVGRRARRPSHHENQPV